MDIYFDKNTNKVLMDDNHPLMVADIIPSNYPLNLTMLIVGPGGYAGSNGGGGGGGGQVISTGCTIPYSGYTAQVTVSYYPNQEASGLDSNPEGVNFYAIRGYTGNVNHDGGNSGNGHSGGSGTFGPGGGGGNGSTGGAGTHIGGNYNGGNGGLGTLSNITGYNVYYGGGGGGSAGSPGTKGSGNGGGGNGASTNGHASAGTPNTGGGGGGSLYFNEGYNGGSGVVIVRYTATKQMIDNGIVTQIDNDYIHTFNSTMNISFYK